MKKETKTKLIITGILGSAVVTYIIVDKANKNKLFKEIMKKINSGVGGYGDMRDFQDWFSGQSFIDKTAHQTHNFIVLKDSEVTQLREKLEDAFHTLTTDEDEIYSVFQSLKDGIAVAQIAKSYNSHNDGRTLYQQLDKRLYDSEKKRLYNILITKPKFRT